MGWERFRKLSRSFLLPNGFCSQFFACSNRATGAQSVQQRVTSTYIPTAIPMAARPITAAALFLSSRRPRRLRINPSGVAVKTASPPRAEREDCQPGRNTTRAVRLPKAIKENSLPTRPSRLDRLVVWLISVVFTSAIVAIDR